MISNTDPQDILNPKPKITSYNCLSTHGTAGFLEGTRYDVALGVYVCPCGRQYASILEKPAWVAPSLDNKIM